jgi:hypothetical protein
LAGAIFALGEERGVSRFFSPAIGAKQGKLSAWNHALTGRAVGSMARTNEVLRLSGSLDLIEQLKYFGLPRL